mmetsp:Transcript_34934/g.71285  ORF Transcript_34934/g.71285 Transcript_34934/m.71285 type:complete len:323 (+) Transcript_34934:54-1022(+)
MDDGELLRITIQQNEERRVRLAKLHTQIQIERSLQTDPSTSLSAELISSSSLADISSRHSGPASSSSSSSSPSLPPVEPQEDVLERGIQAEVDQLEAMKADLVNRTMQSIEPQNVASHAVELEQDVEDTVTQFGELEAILREQIQEETASAERYEAMAAEHQHIETALTEEMLRRGGKLRQNGASSMHSDAAEKADLAENKRLRTLLCSFLAEKFPTPQIKKASEDLSSSEAASSGGSNSQSSKRPRCKDLSSASSGGDIGKVDEMLSMEDLVMLLLEAFPAYVPIDPKQHSPSYIEVLLNCGSAELHPENSQMIRINDFRC